MTPTPPVLDWRDHEFRKRAPTLDAVLLTCDGKLARAPGLGARVELVAD